MDPLSIGEVIVVVLIFSAVGIVFGAAISLAYLSSVLNGDKDE